MRAIKHGLNLAILLVILSLAIGCGDLDDQGSLSGSNQSLTKQDVDSDGTEVPTTERHRFIKCWVDTSLDNVDLVVCNIFSPPRPFELRQVVIDLKRVTPTRGSRSIRVDIDPRHFGYPRDVVVAEVPTTFWPATLNIAARVFNKQTGAPQALTLHREGYGDDFPQERGLNLVFENTPELIRY